MFHKLINLLEQCQLKFDSEDEGSFTGYASVFNSVDKVGDTIAPGAFVESLDSGRTIKMFVNHAQHDVPVGDWTSMKEDSHGLLATGRIDLNHKDGPTVYSALKRGAMDGLSIGFTMKDGDFEQKDDGRLIKNMSLLETSIVSFPCEGQARISAVKADLEGLNTLRDYENYLRDVGGFSKSMATCLVSQIVRAYRRDAAAAEQEMQAKANGEVLAALERLKSSI